MGFKTKIEEPKKGKLPVKSKKITPQEIQYRKNKGLCFKCGKKYGFGHVCKMGNLNFTLAEDEEEMEFEDAIGEQDKLTGNLGQVLDVPLCALSEAFEGNTIVIQGALKGNKVNILIDIGNSHSYISSTLVRKHDLSFVQVDSLSAKIANGSIVVSKFSIPKVSWQIHDYSFYYDLRVMGLGDWDMILG